MTHRGVRRSVALIGLAVSLTAAACAPPKSGPPRAGALISYYWTHDNFTPGNPIQRSLAPRTRTVCGNAMCTISNGTAAQFLNADGSVSLGIDGTAVHNVQSGFYTVPARLGDISTIQVVLAPGSSPVQLELLFDRNGDGEFLTWDASGNWLSDGPDSNGVGPEGTGFTVNDSTVFLMPVMRTLAELKAGAEGVTANTRVTILVYVSKLGTPGSVSATVTQLLINGVDALVP